MGEQPPTTRLEQRAWYAYEVASSAFVYGTVDLLAIFVTDQGARFAKNAWCESEFDLSVSDGAAYDECFESFWAKDFENEGICQTGDLSDNFVTNTTCVLNDGNWIAEWNAQAALVPLFGLEVGFTTTYQAVQTASTIVQIVVMIWFGALADFSTFRRKGFVLFNIISFAPLLVIWAFDEDAEYQGNCAMLFLTGTFLNFALICYQSYIPLLVRHDPKVAAAYLDDSLSLADKLEVKEKKSSTLSATGLLIGYAGALLFLIVVLGIFVAEIFPPTPEGETNFFRLAAMLCGLFGLAVSMGSAYNLNARPGPPLPHSPLTIGVRRLSSTLRLARKLPSLGIFLFAYFLFSDGTSTIGGAVAVFASQELQMGTTDILILLLEVLLLYGLGAGIMIKLKNRYELRAKHIMLANLFMFGLVPIYAQVFLKEPLELYLVAIIYALNFGSLNSLTRSEFANIVPRGHEAEFFSLLQITDKGTAWLGPLLLTVVASATGSFRSAFGTLTAFFWLGALVFIFYSPERADEQRHDFEQAEIKAGTYLATVKEEEEELKAEQAKTTL